MKERPILFNGAMVRALLAGTKTQTRRQVKNPERFQGGVQNCLHCSPYGQPGERLFVRETWAHVGSTDPGLTVYRADYPACVPSAYDNVPPVESITWKPSIHMFRADSRITLEITDVRVERLQDISEADAQVEGSFGWAGEQDTPVRDLTEGRLVYRQLWEQINGAGAWDLNPWVWVVEFKVVTP